MAILGNGTLKGKAKTLVGEMVFATNKGKVIMRSKAEKVNQPNTASQVKQKGKFSHIVQKAKEILTGLRVTLKQATQKMSAYNKFTSLNIDKIDETTGNFISTEIKNLKFAKGSLEKLINPSASANAGKEVSISWDGTGYNPLTDTADTTHFYAYNGTQDKLFYIGSVVKRSDGAYTLTNLGDTNDKVHIFVCTVSKNFGKASDSQYLGEITLIV